MVTKELRDTWWKVLITMVPVVLIAPMLPAYEEMDRIMYRFTPSIAVEQLWNVYSGGGLALALLAVLLGASLVSGETSQNTILLLLAKPISRVRLLIIKYAVCAGILLAAAVLGHALLLIVATFAKGYPLELLSPLGLMLSTFLLWLGSLFALGVALLVSVNFRSVLASIAVTALALFLMFSADDWINYFFWIEYHALGFSTDFPASLNLLNYWSSESLYAGNGLALSNFLVCLIAAAAPFLAALWLFQRKAY